MSQRRFMLSFFAVLAALCLTLPLAAAELPAQGDAGAAPLLAAAPAAEIPALAAPGRIAALPDFETWLASQANQSGQSSLAPAPQAAASCGANFCSAAERSSCAASCHTHVFVGLECCPNTCQTFCICGSRPIGCP